MIELLTERVPVSLITGNCKEVKMNESIEREVSCTLYEISRAKVAGGSVLETLVIDDDELVQKVIERLKSMGFKVFHSEKFSVRVEW